MDRARRAEPYSNATIWTREVAKNLAGHLARMSKVQSCVDTKSPKSTKLPKFQHVHPHKRCTTSPMKTRPLIAQDERAEDDQALRSDRSDQCPVSARVKQEQEQTRALLGARRVKKTHKLPVQPNTREDDHPMRAPSSVASSFDGCAYEQPACIPHHAARPQDFAKKQEQLKIWQENQAMMKRLRSTKPTLNCKEWEKDDKWNQQFLKTQQKRRLSLQHELFKAQGSTHVPPLREMTATASKRPPNEKALSGAQHAPSTAPAHRRIMQLRKLKSVPSETNDSQKEFSNGQPELNAPPSLDFNNPDDPFAVNQLVNVRYTFSRQRQRGKGSKKNVYDAEMMGLSGAFSPAIELEATLEAIAFRKLDQDELIISNNSQITDEPEDHGGVVCTEDEELAEIHAVVFEVMQDSIDRVAEAFCLQLMHVEASESNVKKQGAPQSFDADNEEDVTGDSDEPGIANRMNDGMESTPAASDSAQEIPSSAESSATVENFILVADVQAAENESDPQEDASPVSSRSEQAEEYDGDDFDDEPAHMNSSIAEDGPAPETMIHEPTEYDEENYEEEEEDDGVSYSVDDFQ